jgi:hypothetical protein
MSTVWINRRLPTGSGKLNCKKNGNQLTSQIVGVKGKTMLNYKLLSKEGILILEPAGPLEIADFENLAHEIDPYITEHGKLSGVMIHAKAFPGWANFEAASAHIRFIERHHQNIQRLAVVSDNSLFRELPKIATSVVHIEIRHFPESAYEDAMNWLRSDNEL